MSKRHRLAVHEDPSFRQIDRLINFSDAVIAIAVTLLILPLVDKASDLPLDSIGSLLAEIHQPFLIFVLSFVVICRFWLIHHNLLHSLQKFNPMIFWLNALWLLSIVVMPFPTELIGRAENHTSLVSGLYIANIFITTLAGTAIQHQIRRHPELQKPHSVRPDLTSGIASITLIFVALLVAVVFPAIGPWTPLLLLATGRTSTLLQRLKR